MTQSKESQSNEIHLTELQLSMHADAALSEENTLWAEQHLESCTFCQGKLVETSDELGVLQAAIQAELSAAQPAIAIPPFVYPTSLSKFAMANIATGLVIWLAQFLWKTIFGEMVVNGAAWLSSIYVPDLYEVASATALVYLEEGTAMFDAYLGLIVLCVSILTTLWFLAVYRKNHAALSLGMILVVGASVVAPSPANAIEIRRDKAVVTVAESETVNDTLVVASETILIKGNINGDLLATGRRIEIDGSVSGNVVAFAESVTVRGTVGGLVMGAGSTFELEGSSVGGNLVVAGEKLSIDSRSEVAGNAIMAGNNAAIEGPVGQDLYTFAEIIELNSSVGQNMETFGNRVRLLDEAHVAGNARVRIKSEDNFHRAAGAKVDGEIEFLELPDRFEERNPYATPAFYLWQLAKLVSALLVGLALLWLVPAFRSVNIGGGIEGLKTAGIGLVTIVSLPIVAGVIALTLIGLPFSFVTLVSWMVFIYLAKVVVGLFVGRTLLANTKYHGSDVATLLVGLILILVIVNLPAIGGVVSFVIAVLGVGLIVQHLLAALAERNAEPPLS